jgi:hypothetical protein
MNNELHYTIARKSAIEHVLQIESIEPYGDPGIYSFATMVANALANTLAYTYNAHDAMDQYRIWYSAAEDVYISWSDCDYDLETSRLIHAARQANKHGQE